MWIAECGMLNVEKSESFSIHNSAFSIQKLRIFVLHL